MPAERKREVLLGTMTTFPAVVPLLPERERELATWKPEVLGSGRP